MPMNTLTDFQACSSTVINFSLLRRHIIIWGSLVVVGIHLGVVLAHWGSLGVVLAHWGSLGDFWGHWGSLGLMSPYRYTHQKGS